MRDLKPGHLVVAESYVQPPSNLTHKADLVIDYVRPMKTCIYLFKCIILQIYKKSYNGWKKKPYS